MARKDLFASAASRVRPTNTVNNAGGRAYARSAEEALAQYAATGCFGDTFYVDAKSQLDDVLEHCNNVSDEYLAKLAIYARQSGYMKDMPAMLCAVLATRNGELLEQVFPQVIDNAKMVRNFVQIVRSGVTGRKSLGSLPRRLVRQWLAGHSDDAVFRGNVGQSPSLADVVKLVHPKPDSKEREALYGYMLGREHNKAKLPSLVKHYEGYKAGKREEVPNVPFQMLDSMDLGTEQWVEIFRNGGWQFTRMNLNTAARHGVFEVRGMTDLIAKRLADPVEIVKARVMPYQLLAAYMNAGSDVPHKVRDALHDAMEEATKNVPQFEGEVVVCPDVSWSMQDSVSGKRKGATSKVRCIDVAGLMAATVLRNNPAARVMPFDTDVRSVEVEGRDTVMTNAKRLASIQGGGTSCSAPLAQLNQEGAHADIVVIVSDNESWKDSYYWGENKATALMIEWRKFKRRNPRAKLVCIDITPKSTAQAYDEKDVFCIGGFTDHVFSLVADQAAGRSDGATWVERVKKTPL